MKAKTAYDSRPEHCTSGMTFRVLAWLSALLQIGSLYVVLIQLTSGELPELGGWSRQVPEMARPLLVAAPAVANLLVLIAIGFWFGRFMKRRIREERQLRESENFARSTVDALPTQIAILDGAGVVLATNRAWREHTASKEEGKLICDAVNYLAELDAMAGKYMPEAALLASGLRAVASGHRDVFLMEYDCHTPQRDEKGQPLLGVPPVRKRWFSGRVTKFPDGGRSAAKLVVSHDDISARKLAEEEVHAAKETAELANLAKSQFLANTSHEIRTPMTAILGYAENLLDPKLGAAERMSCARTIRRNGEHLLAIINDILDISKIEAQKVEVERLNCDLPQLIADVVSLSRPWAAKKGLEFEIIFDKLIPRTIQTDPLRTKQVLVNLVSNAIKFTAGGKVKLKIFREISYFAHTMRFEIVDTGIGMTPEQMGRLFQPFTQADASTTRKFGGTGLGLTISKRLANLLGGDITVTSEAGVGSTFTFTLDGGPRQGVELLENMTADQLALTGESDAAEEVTLHGRILLAEDGEDNQDLISTHLRRAGAEVIIAGNGRLAVESVMATIGPDASAPAFDLVLMDMQMPELDGYGATRKLRSAGVQAPIVALTANAMAEDRVKCLECGCTDYLSKPISRVMLLGTVAKYLETSRSERAAAVEQAELSSTTLKSTHASDGKIAKLVERFVSRLPERVSTIDALARKNSLDELRHALHQLKGAGGGYGFASISDMAARAEQDIRDEASVDQIRHQVADLLDMVRRVDGYDAQRESQLTADNKPSA